MKLLRTSVFLMILLFASIQAEAQTGKTEKVQLIPSPNEIGKMIVDNAFTRRFGWRYQMACTYYGSLIFGEAVGDTVILKQMKLAYEPFLKGRKRYHKGHVDYNVFGIWPFEIYRQTGDERYLNIPRLLADDEYKELRQDGLCDYTRFWVDDMYMVGSLQVQAYKSLRDAVYLNRAALQLVTYCEQLQQANGLFYHRSNAPFYWGRGNGWGAAAMAEVLAVLPEDNQYYQALMQAYKKMMATLLEFRGADGMWHQLLDDPESFAETSCTGMFLFSMATGLDHGWLPREEYAPAVEAAWNALAGYVNEKGLVKEVCIGTNAKDNKEHYLTRPRVTGNNHGQAAVLWAATAMVRLEN